MSTAHHLPTSVSISFYTINIPSNTLHTIH